MNFQNLLRRWEQEFLFLGSACLLYAIGLLAGRFFKRRWRIALGWTYQLFIVTLAIYASAMFLQIEFPGRKEIGFLAMVTAAFPINAVADRFLVPSLTSSHSHSVVGHEKRETGGEKRETELCD